MTDRCHTCDRPFAQASDPWPNAALCFVWCGWFGAENRLVTGEAEMDCYDHRVDWRARALAAEAQHAAEVAVLVEALQATAAMGEEPYCTDCGEENGKHGRRWPGRQEDPPCRVEAALSTPAAQRGAELLAEVKALRELEKEARAATYRRSFLRDAGVCQVLDQITSARAQRSTP